MPIVNIKASERGRKKVRSTASLNQQLQSSHRFASNADDAASHSNGPELSAWNAALEPGPHHSTAAV